MHFVIDLETLGQHGTPVILTVGAVVIDDNATLPRQLYHRADIDSCLDLGMTIDGSTVAWWFEQGDFARNEAVRKPRFHIKKVLNDLAQWMESVEPIREQRYVWSHGATFDIPILGEAYRLAGRNRPWDFRNARDTRTLFHLAEGMQFPERSETRRHSALDDAEWEAASIRTAYQYLGKDIS